MDGDKDKYPLSKWEEVVTIKHGKDYKKNIAKSGGYPVYGSGGFMGVYANNYLVNEDATIIGRKGTINNRSSPMFITDAIIRNCTGCLLSPIALMIPDKRLYI